jgi:hypothetical protein
MYRALGASLWAGVLIVSVCAAAPIYVDGGNCPGPGSGTPADPFCRIQTAIEAANDGDEIVIQPGTYAGDGNRDLDVLGKAITLRAVDPNDPATVAATVLDCQGSSSTPHRGMIFQHQETSATVVAGITIRNGYGTVPGGGAVLCLGGSPTFVNCALLANDAGAGWDGGGVYNDAGSPVLLGCTLSNNFAGGQGGGFCNDSGNPMLVGCTLSDNTADFGGGLYHGAGELALTNCTLRGNDVQWVGGGLDNHGHAVLVDCTILANHNDNWGGGLSNSGTVELTRCTVSQNGASEAGGGLNNSGSVRLTDCAFISNGTGYEGGAVCSGLWLRDGGTSLTATNCTFRDNFAGTVGGAVCTNDDPMLTNCTFVDNTSRYSGGGVLSHDPVLTNCTLVSNVVLGGSGSYCGGGLCANHATLENCLLVGNQVFGNFCSGAGANAATLTVRGCTLVGNLASEFYNPSHGAGLCCSGTLSVTSSVLWANQATAEAQLQCGAATVTFSDVQGGCAGAGNFDLDPLFANPAGPDGDPNTWADNDYRLGLSSPCIDTGDPGFTAPAGTADLDGRLRIWDGNGDGLARVDVGAYEYGSRLAKCVGDLNCDGVVSFADLDGFVEALAGESAWRRLPCAWTNGDCNADGVVSFVDIDGFIALMGDTCP